MSADSQFLQVLAEIPSIKLAVSIDIKSGVAIGSPFYKWAKSARTKKEMSRIKKHFFPTCFFRMALQSGTNRGQEYKELAGYLGKSGDKMGTVERKKWAKKIPPCYGGIS